MKNKMKNNFIKPLNRMLLFITVLLIVIANLTLIGSASEIEDPPYINLVDYWGEPYQDESELYDADGRHVDAYGIMDFGEIYVNSNISWDIYLEEFVDGQWWEFSGFDTWLHVSRMGPWDNEELDITVDRYDGSVDRKARIRISDADFHPDVDITRYVYITQKKRTWDTMGLSAYKLTALPTGDNFEVTLTMRGVWDVTADSGLEVNRLLSNNIYQIT